MWDHNLVVSSILNESGAEMAKRYGFNFHSGLRTSLFVLTTCFSLTFTVFLITIFSVPQDYEVLLSQFFISLQFESKKCEHRNLFLECYFVCWGKPIRCKMKQLQAVTIISFGLQIFSCSLISHLIGHPVIKIFNKII